MIEQDKRAPFRAGEWMVLPEANLISKDDVERHLEPKVMKVLLTLAQNPGHVYTKEELIASVWPNTFVSDDALTRCISILRRITEDDAHEPRFIQTVPKVGYRLVAPISELPEAEPAAAFLPPYLEESAISSSPGMLGPATKQAAPTRPVWLRWTIAGVAATLALGVLAVFWQRSHPADSASLKTSAFTGDAGEQTQPSFSPDGRFIAYARTSPSDSSRRIYIKQIGTAASRELNQDPVEQFSPVWSPDGSQIAYLGRSSAGFGIYICAVARGSVSRKVFIPQSASDWDQRALGWSPDGKTLAFPDHMGESASSSIYQLELATLHAQPITSPPAGSEGDLAPSYSLDGRMLAFTRASETAVRDLFVMPLPEGPIRQLTHDRVNIDSFAWDRDSQHIIFSSNRGGRFALWRVGLRDAAPARMPVGADDATQPAVGPIASQLAYTHGSALWSIDRVSLSGGSAAQEIVISSTQEDSAPTLSPNDASFAFQSGRSGSQEIWVASIAGDNLRQLTSANGPVTGSPSWSHHGDRIVYDSRPDGHSHIFAIPSDGGKSVQLTFGNVNDIVPRWSADDSMVYFRSNRGGRWQVWKVSDKGGEPQPVTRDDGMVPQESPDGKWLYFTRGDEAGLWRVSTEGGDETQIASLPAAGYWGYWQVTAGGVFYLDTSVSPAVIRILDPNTRQSRDFAVLKLTPPPYQGMTVFKDGRTVLYTQERDVGRHITLVEAASR